MPLERIALENFTVFNKIDVLLSAGVNVFIGENGTGKTHLLKALYAFCASDTLAKNTKMLFFEELGKGFLTKDFYDFFNNEDAELVSLIGANGKEYRYGVKQSRELEDLLYGTFLQGFDISLKITGERKRDRIPGVFIPAKEMLTHAGLERDYTMRNMPFDKTLVDVLFKAGESTLRDIPSSISGILAGIEGMIEGQVIYENDEYFIHHPKRRVGFQYEAEGYKKLSVLWRLIETGALSPGSALFWDEPEVNMNPQYIPQLVDIILALQQAGIQIFISTHDYILAKYFELKGKAENDLMFHSLYKENGIVCHEGNRTFKDLQNNSIEKAYNTLLDEVFHEITGE